MDPRHEVNVMQHTLCGLNRYAALSFVLALVLTGYLSGQTADGRLHGHITDPSGAVVPGATISAKSQTGRMVSASSDNIGSYHVNGLLPGKYILTINARSFATFTVEFEV